MCVWFARKHPRFAVLGPQDAPSAEACGGIAPSPRTADRTRTGEELQSRAASRIATPHATTVRQVQSSSRLDSGDGLPDTRPARSSWRRLSLSFN